MKRPALDYFGGKWKMANKIIQTFPIHKSFVDVFAGGGSILLRKPRSKNEILNDIHHEVVNFFRVIRDRNLELREKLEKTPYGREEYYACREQSSDELEQARRTVVKSWFGIGDSLDNETGFRVSLSQSGSTTSPWLTYVDYLHLYAERMRGVIIENLDFRECLDRFDKDDTLFYLDPPYLAETRSQKHGYKFEFTQKDHFDLVDLIKNIKGKFVLSGYFGPPYDTLNFERKTFKATSQGGEREETLWLKV